jgi:hypothetical protein
LHFLSGLELKIPPVCGGKVGLKWRAAAPERRERERERLCLCRALRAPRTEGKAGVLPSRHTVLREAPHPPPPPVWALRENAARVDLTSDHQGSIE